MIRLPFKMTTTLAACLALAGGCDESPTGTTGLASGSARFDIVGGNGQQARAGSELPRPLVVRVTNGGGVPVANQIVNFVVTAGGGSMFAGTAITNTEGLAQDYWTLGVGIGSPQEVQVRAVNPSTGSAVVYGSFTATAQGPVATVVVTPDTATVEEDETVQLNATPRDETGMALSDREVIWTSSNPQIATVDANGLVRGVAEGTATIRATSEGRFDEARITVVEPPFIITLPPIPVLGIGSTYQATALTTDGQRLSSQEIAWESSDPSVATVNRNGRVRGRQRGEAVITAVVDGKRVSTPVRVRGRGGR